MKVLRFAQLFPETAGFRRNFFTLISGTTVAQALGLLFLPVLTRIFEPEAFGLFGIFYAIISVLGIIATWRMEMTVVLPKEEIEARQLWKATFFLLCGTTVFLSGAILFALEIRPQTQIPLTEYWLMLSGGLFLTGLLETLHQWHNRRQNFKKLATKQIIERVSVVAFSIVFGLLGMKLTGLIWAQLCALAFCVAYLTSATFPESPLLQKLNLKELRSLVSSYRDFPLMQGWSTLFLIGATQLPNLLFGSAFTMEDTGHVNLAYRLLEAPVNLFAISFALAFYQHISQKSVEEISDMFSRSTRAICKWMLPVFVFTGISSPFLFPIVFGADWASAGLLAAPLSAAAFFKIIYLSHNAIFLVLRRLDLDLKVSGSIVLAQLAGFYGTKQFSTSPAAIVTVMSLLSSLAFIVGLFLIRNEIWRLRSTKTPMP